MLVSSETALISEFCTILSLSLSRPHVLFDVFFPQMYDQVYGNFEGFQLC